MTISPPPEVLAWLDQEDRRTTDAVRRFGVSIEYVSGDARRRETSFAYTIGLFGIAHPELLVAGLDPRTSSLLLSDIAARIRSGGDLVVGEVLEFDGWSHRVTVERIPNPGEIAFGANRFYQRPDAFSVELLQLTYDDREGLFPWEDGYSRAHWIQPRPGELRA
jgi:hypothetical protein